MSEIEILRQESPSTTSLQELTTPKLHADGRVSDGTFFNTFFLGNHPREIYWLTSSSIQMLPESCSSVTAK